MPRTNVLVYKEKKEENFKQLNYNIIYMSNTE